MTKVRSAAVACADVLAFLEERVGLMFPPGRIGDVERSIARIMGRTGARDTQRLLEGLRNDAALLEELLSDLLVGETYFFREPQQFESIREKVLPDLLRNRPLDTALQVWSAGCATGEEAYSLAILLEQEGLTSRSAITATDISASALKKAARGSYEHWSFRGAKSDFTCNYFLARGGRFQLIERIRDKVTFAPANLAGTSYPRPRQGGKFDLILCRNVLIYFGGQTVGQVAQRLFESLNDGGWLIIAPSDPPLWDFAPFETVMTAGGMFYRRAGAPLRADKPSNVIPLRRNPVAVAKLAEPVVAPRARSRVTSDFRGCAQTCEAHAQTLFAANELTAVLDFLARAVVWHPLSRELHYLYAVGLLNRNHMEMAAEIARRLIYLDRRLVAAHMLLGTIAQQRGDRAGAMRAYRNGLSFCGGAGENDIVPLTGSERYGRVAAALAAEIATLQSAVCAR